MDRQRFSAALTAGVILAAIFTARSGTSGETRYYFHSGGVPVNQLDSATFDTTAPATPVPSIASATRALGIAPPGAWTGTVNATIKTLKLDFWQSAPGGDVLGTVDYDVSVVIGDRTYQFPILTEPAAFDVPAEVVHTYVAGQAGVPLPLTVSGELTIQIRGHYDDAEAGSSIVYDSSVFPSGFVVNAAAPPPPPPLPSVLPGLRTATFRSVPALPGSLGFGEPSINIAPRHTKEKAGAPQTIYVSSPRGTTASKLAGKASPMWRSDDGGKTWVGPITTANVGPVETGLGGGDTDIKTDASGNVYMVDLWLGNDTMSISTDKGESWLGSPISHQHFGDDRQWIAYSAKENAMYMDYDGFTGIYLDKADLNGPLGEKSALFFQQERLVEGAEATSPGSLFVDDNRPGDLPYVYLVLGSSKGVDLVRSDDGGSTFSHHYIPKSGTATGNAFEVGAVDAKGVVYVAWAENRDGHLDVFLATTPDHGESWRGPWNVSSMIGRDRTALFPAIAAEGNGHVALAFYGSTDTVDPLSAPDETQWNVYFAESTNGAAAKPSFSLTDADHEFHHGQICGNLGCDLPPGQDRSLLDFFSVAFDDQHMANVIYTRGTGGPSPVTDQPPTPASVTLAFLHQTGSVLLPASKLAYIGPLSLVADRAAALTAKLLDQAGKPIRGAKLSFSLEDIEGTATTDAQGIAHLGEKIDLDPGRYELQIDYFGDGKRHRPISIVRSITVVPRMFSLSTVGIRGTGGGQAGEPSIAVGPEGNLYVSWVGDEVQLSRSTDGGSTWTAGGVPTPEEGAVGDTTVTVDSSGAVYESNLRNIQASTETLEGVLYKSFDQGATWSQRSKSGTSNTATNQPLRVDRQWVDAWIPPGMTTDDAHVYIGYHDFAISTMWVNASKDGGVTFGEPVNVITDPSARAAALCSAFPIGVQIVKSGPRAGRVYAAWSASDPVSAVASACNNTGTATNHSLWIAWSDDGGTTWTDQPVFDGPTFTETGLAIPDLTLDDEGNPYLAFPDDLENVDDVNQFDIFVEASFDGGKTWNGSSDGTGAPYRVTTDKGTHYFATIAAGEPGKVDVAYIGTDKQVPININGKPFPGGDFEAEWNVYLAQSLDLRGGKPTWHVERLTHTPIHVGDVCTIGIACLPGEVFGFENRNLLDFIDVVVDAAGMAHVAYTEDFNETEEKPGTIRVANQIAGNRVHLLARPSAPHRFTDAFLGEVAPRSGGGEPSIAIGPDGYVYLSYPSGEGMTLYRSADGGATWTAGAIPDTETNAGDTTISVDRFGAIYQSDLRNIEPTSETLQGIIYKSFDRGKSWPQRSTNGGTDTATNSPFLVDRQWVDVYVPPGKKSNEARVYISYHDIAGPGLIWVNTSTDGGKTFGPQTLVVTDPVAQANSSCNTIPGGTKVVQSGPHAGRVYVAWIAGSVATNAATGCNYTQLDTFGQLWIAWSDDGGDTWVNQLVHDAGFGHDKSTLFADITLDNQGNPYLTFAQNGATGPDSTNQWDVFVTASFDGGKTWNGGQEPSLVPAGGGTHFFPAIAAGDPGKVDIAYIATDAVVPQLPYGKPAPGGVADAHWYMYMAQSLNLRSAKPTWTVTRLRRQPIHIGDVCTLGIFCAPGQLLGIQDRHLLDFVDVAIDAAGMAHVAYTDNVTDDVIRIANQSSGASLIAGAKRPAKVKGTKTTRKPHPQLPATGVAGPPVPFAVGLLACAAVVARRLRRRV
jgi:hypothetical protein